MKIRKVRREATELIASCDSGTWVPEGEGFGYPPKQFTYPGYHCKSNEEGEEWKEECPHDEKDGDATTEDSDSSHGSMPREEAPVPNKIKFELGPYCPVCTPAGYRCVCSTKESDWDGIMVTYHHMPHAQIKQSWFQSQPETVRMTPQTLVMMTPQGESAPNSPRSERTQTTSEYMESDWDEDLDQIPDYPSRPYYNQKKTPSPKETELCDPKTPSWVA